MTSRLAWFTPLPPDRSGIAAYSVELLPRLSPDFEIDVFTDRPLHRSPEQLGGAAVPVLTPSADEARRTTVDVYSAHDFLWKHAQRPYDLVVYQLGNAICHDYMWAYLFRYPGLVVLHDGQLHHARGRVLLQRNRYDDYRAEFSYNHPDARLDIAELSIAGLLGSLHYFWPMVRTVMDAARVVAVHNRILAGELQEQCPDAHIERISMGVAPHPSDVDGQQIRARYGIPSDATVFAAFGRVTPEKRVSQILLAIAAVHDATPPVHLMLVGEAADYYDVGAEAARLGVTQRVTLTGFVDDVQLAAHTSCADVCLCMRWPSSGETSASWLRCLSAGKPTVITDLRHTVDIPALDPRSWKTLYAPGHVKNAPASFSTMEAAGHGGAPEPVCVAIDILDEDHSLRLAMRRLARDAELRQQLGRRARLFWQAGHTVEDMATDYRRVIRKALRTPPPSAELPEHVRPDGTEQLRRILREVGTSVEPFGPD